MESIINVQHSIKALDRQIINELFGTTNNIKEEYILDEKNGLGKMYKIYKETGIAKAIYLHGASVALVDYFKPYERKEEILGIIKSFAEQVRKLLEHKLIDIKQRTHYMYAIGCIYYIKEDLVSYMSLECKDCVKLEARQPSINEIMVDVNNCIDNNEKYTWILHRINAKFMLGCDEIDSATQLLDMLYNWFKTSKDIEDKLFTMMLMNMKISDPYKELKDMDSVESHLIKYYYNPHSNYKELSDEDELWAAIRVLETSCNGLFKDTTQYLQLFHCLYEIAEEKENNSLMELYTDMKRKFIESILHPKDIETDFYIKAAKSCGMTFDEYIELVNDYIHTYNVYEQ